MVIIITTAIVGGLLFLVFSEGYKTKMQDPATLRSEEIEDSIIKLKMKILKTSSLTAETEYKKLYCRLCALMEQVLERHKHYVLDVEAKGIPSYGFFLPHKNFDEYGMANTTHRLPNDFKPEQFPPELLIYACFFLWHGGHAKNVGAIDYNPDLMIKILDYLIDKNNYGPAIFMKGLVRKYGLNADSECFPSDARKFLEMAKQAGVGSAAVELEHLWKYEQLEGIVNPN